MTVKTYTLPYGKGAQSVELPEEHVLDVLEGRPAPACDVKSAVLEAMRHPIGTKPLTQLLAKGDRVVVVIADITRAYNREVEFIPYILDEINAAGVPDEDISIVIAQGTHRAHTHEEDLLTAGPEALRRVKVYQHDCRDKAGHTYMGTTSRGTEVWIDSRVAKADKVILVNGISTHVFAGFGGGRKLIVPGVAAWETVQQNHVHSLGKDPGSGKNPDADVLKIENNPVSDDMQEGCDMVGPCFMVHSIVNAEGKISSFVAGDVKEAWRKGTEEIFRLQKVPMKEKSDVTIISAGGYPKDGSLYQGTKCYTTAELATKKGGIIIAMIEAEDIMEPEAYFGSFKYKNPADMEADLRKCFTIPFYVAFINYLTALEHTVYLVTRKENHDLIRAKTPQIPVATVAEAWALAEKKLKETGKDDYTVHVIPHGSAVVPYCQ